MTWCCSSKNKNLLLIHKLLDVVILFSEKTKYVATMMNILNSYWKFQL